jgi:hypothetical protein
VRLGIEQASAQLVVEGEREHLTVRESEKWPIGWRLREADTSTDERSEADERREVIADIALVETPRVDLDGSVSRLVDAQLVRLRDEEAHRPLAR